jgi:hypothetical protein
MFQQFKQQTNIHRFIRPRQLSCGTELKVNGAAQLAGPPLSQAQERLIDIKAMNLVSKLRPQEALGPGTAPNICHVKHWLG